jgi:cellulose synthase/poly-beta-1,6-N-acetylglucosamine synthase-like glycosyltransferase
METFVQTYIPAVLLVMGCLTTAFNLYFGITSLVGILKKCPAAPAAPAQTRFAILVAARNEALVVGPLIKSLAAQRYPRALFDIYVAPNNCTDDTAAVATAHGAKLFTPTGRIRSKGDVLRQAVAFVTGADAYDAICVVDADTVVHPDFLRRMNDARAAGAHIAQGYRDSKNMTASAIAVCNTICYWMLSRFYNGGKRALGLSGFIHGTGFMVSVDLLRRLGGWNTFTMTEDYEFSAQCLLAGEKIRYVPEAVTYDEQPVTFLQSWKQRRRWSTGRAQGAQYYLGKLLKHALCNRDLASFDLAITFASPYSFLLSFVSILLTLGTRVYRMFEYAVTPELLLLAQMLLVAFVGCAAVAILTIRLSGRGLRGAVKGILYFTFFLMTWLPIEVLSIFKRQTRWDLIRHTQAMDLGAVGDIG